MIAAVAFGLWLAWQAVVVQLSAAASARGDGATAFAIDRRSVVAANLLADAALLAGDVARARALALRAVDLAPLTPQPVRTLGIVASRAGDEPLAGTWMGLAGALGWRDIPTQVWLTDRLLAAGRYADALPRLDAILRQQPRWPTAFALVNLLVATPQARPALAATLADAPPWRTPFLTNMAGLPDAALADRVQLVALLGASAAPPTRAELAPIVWRLLDRGDASVARDLWLTMAADRRLIRDGLYDGSFTAPRDAVTFLPFDWSIAEDAAGSVAIEPDGAGNPALHVVAGADTIGALASQHVLLPPGGYRLDFRVDGLAGGALPAALGWEVRCGREGASLPVRKLPGGAPGRETLAFAVPASCPVQVLMLRTATASLADTIDVRIDDVTLARRAD